MNISYSQEQNFDGKTLVDFFAISQNPDSKYGEQLVEALKGSTVIHAWDKEAGKLAALISVVDDGKMTAYVRYLVVAPDYRGKGINDELLNQVKEIYKDYPYVFAFAPDDFHASFFTKVGFKVLDNAKVLEV